MIVIATNNGAHHIIELLENFKSVDLPSDVSIVDTQSNDSSFDNIKEFVRNNQYPFTVSVHQTPYRGFDTGAYIYALNNIKASRFYFMQDSVRIKDRNFFKNIDSKLSPGKVVPLVTFGANAYDNQEQIEFCIKHFESSNFEKGIFGPIFSILNEDAQKIDKRFLVWPTSKILQMGMERGWAVLFNKYGLSIDPLEGEYDYGKLVNDQYSQFKKIFCGRN
jgi:hypothetical protein